MAHLTNVVGNCKEMADLGVIPDQVPESVRPKASALRQAEACGGQAHRPKQP
jgi:hypothetical protein